MLASPPIAAVRGVRCCWRSWDDASTRAPAMSVFQRAQCSICTELFDASAAISAVPCGHTFHDHCVTRWLQESETCPQCRQPCKRNRVIHRLYFNQSGDVTDAGDGGDADVARLQNELDEACAKVKQRDSEKADQRAENRRLVTAREHLQVRRRWSGSQSQRVQCTLYTTLSTAVAITEI